MKKISFLLILFLFNTSLTFAQNVRVSIFNTKKIQSISLLNEFDDFYVLANDSLILEAKQNERIKIIKTDSILECVIGSKKLNASSIYFTPKHCSSITRVNIDSSVKYRKYKGSFEVYSAKDALKIVNHVKMKDYLEGVLESESGVSQNTEYYKVQALISRTFAVKNKGRHNENLFDICDGVHCQAYHHMGNGHTKILDGIKDTRNQILVDKSHKLFTVFFHSNCGGETTCTENVWVAKTPGYRSVKDTFCLNRSQSTWKIKIPWIEWKNHLENKYFLNAFENYNDEILKSFEQINRKTFLFDPVFGIPLADVRTFFKLKSTFFSVYYENDFIVLKGKGFGHGIGVCQQGAMAMSKTFYFDQIIEYYLPEAIITSVNINSW